MSVLRSTRPVVVPTSKEAHGGRTTTARHSCQTLALSSRPRSLALGRPLSRRVTTRGLVVRRAEEGSDDAVVKSATTADDSPISAAEALEWGQASFVEGDYQRAVELFREVFTLPGSGSMRYKGTLREISCASEGEENAALYNIACAYAKLGDTKMALQALSDCLSNGFDSFEAMKTDPDLASVCKTAEFAALMVQYDSPVAGLFGKKGAKNDAASKKSWLDRW